MLSVYLVAKREGTGIINLHSVKAFHNRQDAIEYLEDSGLEEFGSIDDVMMFVDNVNKPEIFYIVKQVTVREPGDRDEITE